MTIDTDTLCFRRFRDAPGVMSVLLHGFTGAPASWDEVARNLRGAVATLCLPGHCGAPVVGADFTANVDLIAAAIARGAGGKVRLIGYSMGARIALGVALEHPDLICDLGLIGVHPGLADPAGREQRISDDRGWIDLLHNVGLTGFVDAWERLPMWASQNRIDPAARARQRALRLAHDPNGLADALATLGLGVMPCYRDRIGELVMPTRLLCGAKDARFVALGRELCQRPQARRRTMECEVIPNAGHNLLLESPLAVATALG